MHPRSLQAPEALFPVECRTKAGTPFLVRLASGEDYARLQGFYEVFEPKRSAQGLPPLGSDRIRGWLESILPGGIHLLVEEQPGVVAGHAFLVATAREGEAEYAIFLHQSLRGQGVGTQVNHLAIEAARAVGLSRLWLSVEPSNRPAIRSYQKVGFHFLPSTIFSTETEMELELERTPPHPSPCRPAADGGTA